MTGVTRIKLIDRVCGIDRDFKRKTRRDRRIKLYKTIAVWTLGTVEMAGRTRVGSGIANICSGHVPRGSTSVQKIKIKKQRENVLNRKIIKPTELAKEYDKYERCELIVFAHIVGNK